jgi:hypothetical protein
MHVLVVITELTQPPLFKDILAIVIVGSNMLILCGQNAEIFSVKSGGTYSTH